MNTVYSLVPEGRQPASHRLLEVLCLGAIPIVYTHKEHLFWPWPTNVPESDWLGCVHVFRYPYMVSQLAYDFKFGHGDKDGAQLGLRQAACENLRSKVCSVDSRATLTITELAAIEAKHKNASPASSISVNSGSVITATPGSRLAQSDPARKMESVPTVGVIYFAYGAEAAKFEEQAARSAEDLKSVNPELQIAFGGHHRPNTTAIDHFISIPPVGAARQWYTRILYMMESPFDITYSIDTQTMACAPLDVSAIRQMMETYDIAITSKYCDSNEVEGQLMPAGGCVLY